MTARRSAPPEAGRLPFPERAQRRSAAHAGAAAARFLNDVIAYLEAPSRLLLAP